MIFIEAAIILCNNTAFLLAVIVDTNILSSWHSINNKGRTTLLCRLCFLKGKLLSCAVSDQALHLQNENIEVVEDKINCGQVEELIDQAKNELSLAEKMLLWKPWEKLTKEAPPNQWTWPPHK